MSGDTCPPPLPLGMEQVVGINDLACAHPIFTLPSPLFPSWCVQDWGSCWLQLEGSICFHHQGKELKAAVTRYLVPLPGQNFRRVTARFLSVCPSHILVFDVHVLVQKHPCSHTLPASPPRAALPSSGHGGAPAHCRWSARCPGSTPRGPPCREHSKATVLADGHCLDLLTMLLPPHWAGQQRREQPPLLPQLCHGPCPSSSPSTQLSLIALGT